MPAGGWGLQGPRRNAALIDMKPLGPPLGASIAPPVQPGGSSAGIAQGRKEGGGAGGFQRHNRDCLVVAFQDGFRGAGEVGKELPSRGSGRVSGSCDGVWR